PVPDARIEIRRDGRVLPEREIGDLWVRSPALMSGYLDEPDRTASALRDGWLATGDLAYLAGGELYVVGRDKEIIIRGGKNLDPVELEEAAARAPGVRGGGAVAVGVDRARLGTELAVLVVEKKAGDPIEIEAAVKREVRAAHLEIDRVFVVGAGWLPRTT